MTDHTRNLNLERYLLGSVLVCDGNESRKMWSVIRGEIQGPHAFSERDYQFIAMVMDDQLARGLYLDGMSICTSMAHVSFSEAMDRMKEIKTGVKRRFTYSDDVQYSDSLLAAVGGKGSGYNLIADLACGGCTKFETVRSNARTLAEYHRLRQCLKLAEAAVTKLEGPSGLAELRHVAENLSHEVIKVIGGRSGTKSVADAVEAVVAEHEFAKTAEKRRLPEWPLTSLNRLCRFREGSFVVLAATSGGGKTSLALQTAEHSAEVIGTDGCVGIVSREMTAEDLTRIMASRRNGCTVEDLESGTLSADVLQNVRDSLSNLAKTVVVCDSMEKLSYKEVCAWARSQHSRTNGALRLLVVDHLGLLDPENPRQSDYERISYATRAFKSLAMELRIVVLSLCQLNKEGQRKMQAGKPEGAYGVEDWSMIDLKGSGSIGHDADQVVFICKQGPDGNGTLPVAIKCDKNRWGSRGAFNATFHKAKGQTFIEAKPAIKHGGMPDTPPDDSEDVF